jgi:hypothetical protein
VGSSPSPSNLYNQCVRCKKPDAFIFLNYTHTQFLRTRPKQTSIKRLLVWLSVTNFSFFILFWCGNCDTRGIREKSLSPLIKFYVVANVAIHSFDLILLIVVANSYFQVRSNCVIACLKITFMRPSMYMDEYMQGIDHLLSHSILVIFILFWFIGGSYGNDS